MEEYFSAQLCLGDEGQRQTGVAVEEELKRHVKDLALDDSSFSISLIRAGHIDQVRGVANHVGVAKSMTCSLGQLVPNMQPFTIMFILR